MRIAFYSDVFYPELSGITDSLLITGRALARRGHSVLYVGPRYGTEDYAVIGTEPSKESEATNGFPVVRMPSLHLPHSPTGQTRFTLPFGAPRAEIDAFDPDIIHTHGPYAVGLAALRAAKRLKVPLVGTNHTPIEEYFPAGKSLMRAYDAWYYNHCDFMTTPYAELIAHMQGAGFRRRARELPNPVELSLFRQPHAAEKTELKRAMGLAGPTVLYVGNFYAGKNIDVTLEAVARLLPEFPTLTFVVVGRGEEEERLRILANRLGIERSVRFTGFVPMKDLLPYYQAADLFAIMSTVDTQSIALMQAFASGLPAIGAKARGLPDFLPPTCGFLVEPGDAAELAARMREIILDIPLQERMGRAAVDYVRQFAPDTIAERWEEIYLLAKRGKKESASLSS